MNVFNIAVTEGKRSILRLCLISVVVMCIFGVALSLLSLAISLPKEFKFQIDKGFPDGISLNSTIENDNQLKAFLREYNGRMYYYLGDEVFDLVSVTGQEQFSYPNNIKFKLENADMAFEIVTKGRKMGVEFSDFSGVSEYINSCHYLEVAMYSLMSLVFCIGGVVLYLLFSLYLKGRMKHIGLLKALGLSLGRIAMVYAIILLFFGYIALLLGGGLSFFINQYVASIGEQVFAFEFNIGFEWIALLFSFVIVTVICCLLYFLIYFTIAKTSVVEILREEA